MPSLTSERAKCVFCAKRPSRVYKCAACHAAYCSKNCQRAHWQAHKPWCKIVAEGIREMEHDKQQAAAAGKTGKTEIDVLADMKRWMLSHSEMFDFVICQALKVDIVKPLDRPDQCILIDVDYAPPDARGRLPKRQQQFIIKKCTVCDAPPEYRYWEFSEPGLADLHRLSEEIKANGGVGVNIVSLRCLSKEARFAQPIIIKDRPLAQRRLWVENWEELFRKVTAGEISEQSVNELWTKLKLYYLVDDDSKYAVARLGPGCVMGTHKSFMDPEYERPFALQIRDPVYPPSPVR